MNRHTLLLALCLVPALAPAQSQEGMGLDLTEETQPKSEESPTPPPAEEAAPAATATRPVEEEAPPPEALPPLTDITQEDRVKSVQRKVYRKQGRFELTPLISVSVNDPFYSKVGVSLRGAYYLADTLAISARGSLMQVVPSDDVRTAKRAFYSKIYNSVPEWSAMGDVEWSPLYGKVAFLNSILHFDGYLLAGAGVVKTETSSLPGRGLNPAADLGLGMRFVAQDFIAVNVALINTSYVDQPLGSAKGAIQNVMTLNAGISLFLPFRSTGRDAE
ncbi:outer membrane beta-barrel domain-containing protein [Myxococcus sp. CA051A]|uniref:Outer membrane beta-barrel domain-containing protein n=1 Tax=Myxococcus llanfairpwllgwyngyllgogerychwyrndrobwllllantysiliogogogochensis TaxID=2590453 RepID=A0A540WII2_9BACT|nr:MULTISPECIES: outer membrane beta-barrel domain-containing protein [Myxococcus]NTX04195.1 outer membrane beta-barrel domain-containing protein [Myxococcus sp. CA040A]NTX13185.1 outer membrane beta-barrel domain-containing protein [Myxococcus sp. CA056]NTX36364.1 outer membrane beta-barrel domain-containing protein [Myxococcus sp. CA033]NTX58751.1 outer membrane beta-barrel domain-containing protein [Myxococcus sp. CA039A]NTX64672.1 outer membrane beta-barrel domain-containing protein [Myxoc